MFKKIVSNLPFSPALIGQLAFYAKRLKKEETTRRLGLIFIALALAVQSLAVFIPPTSANASSETDMVNGGIGNSINNFLKAYDSNTKKLKDVMNYTGITRAEIAATSPATFKTGNKLSWGFASRFSYSDGERQHNITNSQGQKVTTVYSRPLKLWGSSSTNIYGWVGNSKTMGWFAIMQSCGNLVTDIIPPPPPPPPPPEPPKCALNPLLLASDPNCKPCPGNETIWINDKSCIPNIINSKKATNTSQGFVDASSVTARASDQISYTITAENTGLSPETIKLEEKLSDVFEYATLVDGGGGTLDSNTKILSWPDITLNPKDKQTRTFVIKILDTIPATAKGSSDPTSYDCIISNIFGNSVNINIECPTPKVIEVITSELPKTGPTENILFSGIVLAITAYFYAYTRQIKKEVRIIRKDSSNGAI
ncbi:MAG: hypothetical protein WCK26_02545 [Candidatus Saccharibacteria bacterium]